MGSAVGASIDDVNLVVIYQGNTRYWSCIKGGGNVFLDTRAGLFSDAAAPDLSWIEGTHWEDMLLEQIGPLVNPTYGDLVFDFDHRIVTDNTNYGSPFELHPTWLFETWGTPAEAVVSVQSLTEHLAKQRIRVLSADDIRTNSPGTLLKNDYVDAGKQLDSLISDASPMPVKVAFDLPAGWRFINN